MTSTAEELRDKAMEALTTRLVDFRSWLKEEAGATVHSSVCIVNGDATDGTKNAPVLTLGSLQSPLPPAAGGESESTPRLGSVEGPGQESLYARTMGCQVRAVREIKKGDALMTMPRAAMMTPDVVACSDAGRAVLACCKASVTVKGEDGDDNMDTGGGLPSFWDAFGNTRELEQSFNPKISRNSGPQLLVKILQERKRAETAQSNSPSGAKLAARGSISTRAPLLALLIHQRFHPDAPRPPVASRSKKTKEQFKTIIANDEDNVPPNALQNYLIVTPPPNSPDTFGPYIQTWPSAVLIPICWTRNELALLSGCIPGIAILQDVASTTMQLASEFIALLEAGILERFPETFPPGLITWDRWVWAASIVASRAMPVTCYIDKSHANASTFQPRNPKEFQSPAEIWDELGVMVPLLDMLNHEIESQQVKWEPNVEDGDHDGDEEEPHSPRAILEKKAKKGNEIYTAYGDYPNNRLICQYGMAHVNNAKDEVRIGWGLSESVGGVAVPENFAPPVPSSTQGVYECNDTALIDKWWTEDRLKLLQTEALSYRGAEDGESLIASLKQGRKLSAFAYNDKSLHPILLAAVVVATLPPSQVTKVAQQEPSTDDNKRLIVIHPQHENSLRNSLALIFSRKLEKLLGNLDSGLKAHYTNTRLWTKATKGGLRYNPASVKKEGESDEKDVEGGEGDADAIGWQTFFEGNAFGTIMEVEKNAYYAMAPDSCVLSFYDGQLRALQASLDSVTDDETFQKDVKVQLENIGYSFSDESVDEDMPDTNGKDGSDEKDANGNDAKSDGKDDGADKKASPGRRRRNRKKKEGLGIPLGVGISNSPDKPPALKLHVGNLAYSTTPSDLYDFFSTMYGKDNILECHIPVERESGRSRGFGFVTMPESIASKALASGKKHEIAGRLLKVARSNSAGTTDSSLRAMAGIPQPGPSKDRCATCGYRPRYCVCQVPNLPPPPHSGHPPPPHHHHHNHPPPPGPGPGPGPPRNGHGGHYDHPPDWRREEEMMRRGEPPPPHMMDRYGSGGGRDRYMEDRYGRPRGYERGYSGGHGDDRRDYDRYEDRDRRRGGERSRSYSDYDRDDRRDRKRRSRDRSRDRSIDSRSPSRRRGDKDEDSGRDSHRRRSSRERDRESRRGGDSDRYERDHRSKRSRSPRGGRSPSRSRSPERSRKKKSKKRES